MQEPSYLRQINPSINMVSKTWDSWLEGDEGVTIINVDNVIKDPVPRVSRLWYY